MSSLYFPYSNMLTVTATATIVVPTTDYISEVVYCSECLF